MTRMNFRAPLLLLLLALGGCTPTTSSTDAGPDPSDAGPLRDAGPLLDAGPPADAGTRSDFALVPLDPPAADIVVADIADDGTLYAATDTAVYARRDGAWTPVLGGVTGVVDIAAIDTHRVVVGTSTPSTTVMLVDDGAPTPMAAWDNCVDRSFHISHDGRGNVVTACAYYAGVARSSVADPAASEVADGDPRFAPFEAIVHGRDDVVTISADRLYHFTGGDWGDPTAWTEVVQIPEIPFWPSLASPAPGEYVLVAAGGFAARVRDGVMALESTGVDTDLNEVVSVPGQGDLAVGAAGVVLLHAAAGWEPVELDFDGDLAHVRTNERADVVITSGAGDLFVRAP